MAKSDPPPPPPPPDPPPRPRLPDLLADAPPPPPPPDPPPPPPRTEYEGRWYQKRRVRLDGNTFKNCRFDDCTLVTSDGDLEIINCFLSGDCRIALGDTAVRVAQLLNHDADYAFAEALCPERLASGNITIPRGSPQK